MKTVNKNKNIKWLFKNDAGDIRNGWWIAIFIAMVAVTRPIYSVLKSSLADTGAGPEILELIPIGLILVVSFLCLKLRKETLADMGLQLNKRAASLFTKGIVIATIQVSSVMLAIYLIGGVSFEFNTSVSATSLLIPMYLVLLTATFEELLSRGFVFQRLIDGLGLLWALLITGILFSIGHMENPEMSGLTKIIASINLGLSAIVFGLAYYKTKSLLLPIGMHFAWNFVMGRVFGAGVSGFQNEGVLLAELGSSAVWLTGGKFGPEASIFATVAELVVLYWIWSWKDKPIDIDEGIDSTPTDLTKKMA